MPNYFQIGQIDLDKIFKNVFSIYTKENYLIYIKNVKNDLIDLGRWSPNDKLY